MAALRLISLFTSVQLLTAQFPFQDPTLPWDTRVDDLVSRLTLDEIQQQTIDVDATPAIPRLGIKPYVWSTECVRGQQATNTTAFPHSIGLSSSWNYSLVHAMATAVSYEVRGQWNGHRAQGSYHSQVGLTCFSPVINIVRHPLWGRIQETYGEDPYLSGSFSQAFVTGLKGDHPRYLRVGSGCKHFDVHGGPEDVPVSRFTFDSKVSTRDWRMTFLPAFKMCVDAGSYSLMCSYNKINGIPACANTQLLTNITRNEWGFKGYIVSDWDAVNFMQTQHHYTKNPIESVTAAIKAGVNLELASPDAVTFDNQIKAYQMGKLTEDDIRKNVRPLMYTRLRLGEFDPEDMNPYNKIDMSVVQNPEHRALAVNIAQQTFVLLKNNQNLLPLKSTFNKVAIIGPMADNPRELFGDYTSNVVLEFTTTPLKGLSKLAQGTVSYTPACDNTHCQSYDPVSIMQAVGGSDLVIVALGTGCEVECEGTDRSVLDLPGHQLDVLKDVVSYASGKPVILLLFNAGPLDITWAKLNPNVHAILACFFPAQSTGEALFNLLTATGPNSVPAGRLSVTWPANMGQVPEMTDYTMVGRTYRYFLGDPLYPFGYGLSYSTFQYSQLSLSPSVLSAGSSLTVSVTVTNMGPLDAEEVTQVYLQWPSSTPVPLPHWQLVAFNKTHIPLNTYKTLTFIVAAERFQVWIDDSTHWNIPSGDYTLYVGGQQPKQRTNVPSNVLTATFHVQ